MNESQLRQIIRETINELTKDQYKKLGDARRATADYYEAQAARYNEKADRARDMQFGQTQLRNTDSIKRKKKPVTPKKPTKIKRKP